MPSIFPETNESHSTAVRVVFKKTTYPALEILGAARGIVEIVERAVFSLACPLSAVL
jgi:hypothetical protein